MGYPCLKSLRMVNDFLQQVGRAGTIYPYSHHVMDGRFLSLVCEFSDCDYSTEAKYLEKWYSTCLQQRGETQHTYEDI